MGYGLKRESQPLPPHRLVLHDIRHLEIRDRPSHAIGQGVANAYGESCLVFPPKLILTLPNTLFLNLPLDSLERIYFDMRTLHGGISDVIPTQTVRRYTLRMTKEDGVLRYRGDWAKGEREMFEAAGYKEGDAIAGDFFPQLYPKP